MSTEQIIGLIVACVAAIFGSTGFWNWLSSRQRKDNNEGKLLKGIAYQMIVEACKKHISHGYIDPDEYNELYHYLYLPYHNSGGNGTAEKLINEVNNLPSKKGED